MLGSKNVDLKGSKEDAYTMLISVCLKFQLMRLYYRLSVILRLTVLMESKTAGLGNELKTSYLLSFIKKNV